MSITVGAAGDAGVGVGAGTACVACVVVSDVAAGVGCIGAGIGTTGLQSVAKRKSRENSKYVRALFSLSSQPPTEWDSNKQYERDELTRFALLQITIVIVRGITPKVTRDRCQEEEGERQKQFHHGGGRLLFI
jgi:hypothetical protein